MFLLHPYSYPNLSFCFVSFFLTLFCFVSFPIHPAHAGDERVSSYSTLKTKPAPIRTGKIVDGPVSFYEEQVASPVDDNQGGHRKNIIGNTNGAAGHTPLRPKCNGPMSIQDRQNCLNALRHPGSSIGEATPNEMNDNDMLNLQQSQERKSKLEEMQSNVMKKADDTQNGTANNLK